MSFLILGHVVIAVLAFRTFQCDSCAHNFHLAFYLEHLLRSCRQDRYSKKSPDALLIYYMLLMVAKPSNLGIKKRPTSIRRKIVTHGMRGSQVFSLIILVIWLLFITQLYSVFFYLSHLLYCINFFYSAQYNHLINHILLTKLPNKYHSLFRRRLHVMIFL